MSEDRTLARIAALLRQAEGTDNEHEADAFLQAAQRLATLNAVDLAVARAHTRGRERRAQPTHRTVTIGERGKRGLRTYVRLFLAVASANDVTCDIAHNSTYVIAYGFPDDIATAESLYASLVVQMVRASDAFLRSGEHRTELVARRVVRQQGRRRSSEWEWVPVNGTTARLRFQEAFAVRIGERLREARESARAESVAAERAAQASLAATGTDVAAAPGGGPTSTEIALRQKDLEVRDYHRETSSARGVWRGSRATAGDSSLARRAGGRAADAARLGTERELGGSRRALGGR